MARLVQCVKLGRELPGLERVPVGGELGERIFEVVSAEAWKMWQAHATLLMNHYGLNMADPRTREALREEMEEYFFGENARVPEGWTGQDEAPDVAPRGKGGAPQAKGGGPRRK